MNELGVRFAQPQPPGAQTPPRNRDGCTGTRRFWPRREFLWQFGGGLGAIAFADLLHRDGKLSAAGRPRHEQRPHYPGQAKRVLQLFMTCGVSQVDSFDHKPSLAKYHDREVGDIEGVDNLFFGKPGKWMQSPFAFRRHGECGKPVSEIFPHLAGHVDRMAFIHSMQALSNSHGPACFQMNTGFIRQGHPAAGAWVIYGLGRESEDLPAHVVLLDRGRPPGHAANWSAGFLPSEYQGVVFRSQGEPILDLQPAPDYSGKTQRDSYALLEKLNAEHLERRPEDGELAARMHAYELAARMQTSAPEATDLSRETPATRRLYGVDRKDPEQATFSRNCLLARRLLERDVRYVTLYCGGPNMPTGKFNWDAHKNLEENHRRNAAIADQPVAALLTDLARRGLLEETLVTWTMEFGRTPMRQGKSTGRDHNTRAFTTWLAGAGVNGGVSYGKTDEFGFAAVEHPTSIYDFHATLLHLLGFDHTKLTYYHNGREQRLTDVHGHVLEDVVAQ